MSSPAQENHTHRQNTPKKVAISHKLSKDGKFFKPQPSEKIDEELESCVKNMLNPVFGYPLMDFSTINLHQIPQDFLMNFNQEVLERELSMKKSPQELASESKRGLAFVAEKVLNSTSKNFKSMVQSYMHHDINFQEKLEEFTYGSKLAAIQHRLQQEAQKKQSQQNLADGDPFNRSSPRKGLSSARLGLRSQKSPSKVRIEEDANSPMKFNLEPISFNEDMTSQLEAYNQQRRESLIERQMEITSDYLQKKQMIKYMESPNKNPSRIKVAYVNKVEPNLPVSNATQKHLRLSSARIQSFARSLINSEATEQARLRKMNDLRCHSPITPSGTPVDRPDLLKNWLVSTDGQQYILKNKLHHLMPKKKKVIERYNSKTKKNAEQQVEFNATKVLAYSPENDEEHSNFNSYLQDMKDRATKSSKGAPQGFNRDLRIAYLPNPYDQVQSTNNLQTVKSTTLVSPRQARAGLTTAGEGTRKRGGNGQRFQDAMKRQFLMSIKKHETLIGSTSENFSAKIKSGIDVASFSSKDSKKKIQFLDEFQTAQVKDWQVSQEDETIEAVQNKNIVQETDSIQNVLAGFEFDPKSLPLDQAVSEKVMHQQVQGPSNFRALKKSLELTSQSHRTMSQRRQLRNRPNFQPSETAPTSRGLSPSFMDSLEQLRLALKQDSSQKPEAVQAALNQLNKYKPPENFSQKLKRKMNTLASSPQTEKALTSRTSPTLRELENEIREIESAEKDGGQIKKVQDSAIKLNEISKQIVRSKLYERAIKMREKERALTRSYAPKTAC